MPYEQAMFDKIACIAVLIHNSPEACKDFFWEAFRVLKPNGRIVISIMHPALYQKGSPNRTSRASWAQYKPLENKSMLESQRFEEVYKNSLGDIFTSVVWYHPEGSLQKLLKEVGFSVLVTQSVSVNNDTLRKCNQTGEVNYPGFQQILAKKG
jgi:ubiquinone/menaquinone biosynthesis C-methylase UbiE